MELGGDDEVGRGPRRRRGWNGGGLPQPGKVDPEAGVASHELAQAPAMVALGGKILGALLTCGLRKEEQGEGMERSG